MNEHYSKIADLIYASIRNTLEPHGENYELIKVNNQKSFEVEKFVRVEDFSFNELRIEELFNPEGFTISGYLIIRLRVFRPHGDNRRNLREEISYKFELKEVPVKYSYETNNFELTGDVKILYISDYLH